MVAYERRVIGTGTTYQKRHRMRVQCSDCRVQVSAGSLINHCQNQNDMGQGDHPPPLTPHTPGEAHVYWGILPYNDVATLVPSRGVPGKGVKSDQPLGSLCAPPRAVHSCDNG